MSAMRRTRSLLVGSLTVLAAGVLSLLVLLLRQGATHDRVLMEYRASQALSGLIDRVVAGTGVDVATLPVGVTGFGAYGIDGEALQQVGTAPATLPSPAQATPDGPGGGEGSEWASLQESMLRLVRAAGSRGAFGRGGGGRGGGAVGATAGAGSGTVLPPSGRIHWLVDYDVTPLLRERRLRVAVIVGLFATILGFSLATVSLVNTVRRAEIRSRRTQALAQLGAAARTITHEIRNPLAAIRLQTSLLRRMEHDPRRAEQALTVIDEEVARLGALAEGVRSFLGDPRGTPEPIAVCRAVQTIAARQEFAIDVDCAVGTDAVVRMDRLRFESVITNLCTNAWQAQGGDSAVVVRVELRSRTVVVTVLDRGPGVPANLRERVFDPFFTTRDGGSGVGLAAARAFVEAADGRIGIGDRSDGGGAAVTVELAAAGEDER